MKFSMNKFWATLALGVAITGSTSAQRMYYANLDTAQAHPTVASTGTGSAWVSFDPATNNITYEVTVANLVGTISSAHIHMGAAGVLGGVYQPITFTGNTATGTITGAPDSIMLKLFKEELYFNIHTNLNSSGEIRGQIKRPVGRAFKISADGAQETTAATGTGKGTGYAILDSTGTVLNYYMTYTGLTGSPTSAHLHDGAAGASGSPLHTITTPVGTSKTFSGSWTGLTKFDAAKVIKDGIYVNIHTTANANGEIRGQLLRVGKVLLAATLNGANQVTPVTTNCRAQWYGLLDPAAGTMNWQMTYAQASSAVSAAHYHLGAAGVAGGVVATIPVTGGNTNNGTWASIPDSTMGDLVQRNIYINVHTANNAGGEVRGQINHKWGAFFTIDLDGAQAGVATSATGTGWATMDAAGTYKYWITVAGLSGAVTSAHLHEGAVGASGPVATTFVGAFAAPTDGTGIGTGDVALTDAYMISALKSNTYVNIHTAANAGGEIRGQAMLNKIYVATGVRQVLENSQLRVFPNPATDAIQVEIAQNITEPAFVQLFDINGRMVSNEQMNLTQGINTISIQQLPAGVYMLMIRTEKQAIGVQKIVKQ